MTEIKINDKLFKLEDDGVTGGGRKRMIAQVYVPEIGQVFIRAYSTSMFPPPPAATFVPPSPPARELAIEREQPTVTTTRRSGEVDAMILETLRTLSDRLNDLDSQVKAVTEPVRRRKYARRQPKP